MKSCIKFYPLWALSIAAMLSFPVFAEDIDVPAVNGFQDHRKLYEDLKKLEGFVYRSLGPNRHHSPVSEKGATLTEVQQGQVDILSKKLEDVSEQIPSLLNRLEHSEHTIQQLTENNKTFVQYLNHFKKLLADEQAKNHLLAQKIAKIEKEKNEIATLPPLEETAEPVMGREPTQEKPLDIQEALGEPSSEKIEEAVNLSTEELDKKARGALLTGQYDVAEKAYGALLEHELPSEQKASTHFYLGEIANVKKDHAKASEHYLKSFQSDPSGSKAPKSLLKLSMKLHALDKKKAACASLGKLLSEYPTADSATRTMAAQKKKEYMCAP